MSELKVHRFITTDELFPEANAGALYYSKPEADKVIDELKNKLQNVSSLHKETREWLLESQKLHKRCADNAIKVIRHQKYKRCLDKARWCFEKSYSTTLVKYDKESDLFRNFYDWWGKRWMKLAEKFKEAK